MDETDKELMAENPDVVRAVSRLLSQLVDQKAQTLATVDYRLTERPLLLARAELEGHRQLLTAFKSKLGVRE